PAALPQPPVRGALRARPGPGGQAQDDREARVALGGAGVDDRRLQIGLEELHSAALGALRRHAVAMRDRAARLAAVVLLAVRTGHDRRRFEQDRADTSELVRELEPLHAF